MLIGERARRDRENHYFMLLAVITTLKRRWGHCLKSTVISTVVLQYTPPSQLLSLGKLSKLCEMLSNKLR